MNMSEDSVFKVLRAVAPEGLSAKEILIALNQRANKKTRLKKALRKLAQKKICYKRDNQYFLHEDFTSADSQNRRQKGPRLKKELKTKRSKKPANEGIFLFQSGLPVIYKSESRRYYPLDRRDISGLLHGDRVSFHIPKKGKKESAVRLESVLHRNVKTLHGRLRSTRRGQWLFETTSDKIPQRFKVVNSNIRSHFLNSDVFLDIVKYPLTGKTPEGRINTELSGIKNQRQFINNILTEHKIQPRFSKKTLNDCKSIPSSVRTSKSENRVDLRAMPFITIDGEDAKDFDDAIFVEREGQDYRLWVSIADVSSYVPKDKAIDKEAKARATSVYLPGMVIPMLPEKLSNGVCSLKKGVNRKTLTCELTIDSKGRAFDMSIYQSLNRIARRYTYEEVDRFYQSDASTSEKRSTKSETLRTCRELAEILGKKRAKRGALDFSLPETCFVYDSNGNIEDIKKLYQTPARRVIEQFMLEANENVARFCESNGIRIIWRNHPPPLPNKLKDLQRLFWENNLEIPELATSRDLSKALKDTRANVNRELLEYSVLRTLSLAVYETDRRGHFGIATSHYCHFTSPIRRYPDLVTHRAIIQFLCRKKTERIHFSVAEHASEKEQNATKAERQVTKYQKLLFLSDKIGDIMKAKIVSAQPNGCYIEIESLFAEGFIPYASIRDDIYIFDERSQTARGRQSHFEIKRNVGLKAMLTYLDTRYLLPEFTWIEWSDDTT